MFDTDVSPSLSLSYALDLSTRETSTLSYYPDGGIASSILVSKGMVILGFEALSTLDPQVDSIESTSSPVPLSEWPYNQQIDLKEGLPSNPLNAYENTLLDSLVETYRLINATKAPP